MKTRLIAISLIVLFGLASAQSRSAFADTSEDDDSLEEATYPAPPWSRTVNALRTSNSQNSAKLLVQSAIDSSLSRLKKICQDNRGKFSATAITYSCSSIGTGSSTMYNCNGHATGRCGAITQDD